MSFLVFKLIFAVMAVGLLVILLLVIRQIRSGRQPQAPKPPREKRQKAVREKPVREAKAPRLGRRKAEPEPEVEAPPPVRRRQLHSFAENERLANGEEPLLPAVPAEPEPDAAWHDDPPMPQPAPEPEPSPVAEAPEAGDARPYDAVVLEHLEAAFAALEAQDITLAAYRERLFAEQAAVEHRIAVIEQSGGDELEAALAARESVQWCLDWAAQQAPES